MSSSRSANPLGPAVIPGCLLVFALGAKGKIAPLTTNARPAPVPVPVPTTVPEVLTLGEATHARRCAVCHGAEAVSAGTLPDLRYPQPATFDRYHDIVLGGALASTDMPSFKPSLSEADLAAIKAYVLTRRALISK